MTGEDRMSIHLKEINFLTKLFPMCMVGRAVDHDIDFEDGKMVGSNKT